MKCETQGKVEKVENTIDIMLCPLNIRKLTRHSILLPEPAGRFESNV
jgi:hypothetical protein